MFPTSITTKHTIAYTLCSLFSITSHYNLHAAASYQDIANAYLPSFGIIEQQNSSANKVLDNKKEKPENDSPSLDVLELSQHERRTKTFELLANKNEESNGISNILRELETFYGSGEARDKHILSCVNRTLTSFGEAALAHILANPTTNIDQIKNRQELVKHLLVNPELRAEVEHILQITAQNESAFLANWQEENKLTKEAIDKLYFGKYFNRLNNSPYALELGVRLSNLNSLVPAVDPFVFACIPYLQDRDAGYLTALKKMFTAAKDAYNPFAYAREYNDLFTEEYRQKFREQTELNIQNQEAFARSISGNPDLELARPSEDEISNSLKMVQKIMPYSLAVRALAIGFYTYSKYTQTSDALSIAINQHKGHTYLQTKLLGLARVLNATEDLAQLIDKNEIVLNGLVNNNIVQDLLYGEESADLQSFVETLRTKTFKGSPSFFSRMGRVLAAAKQAEKLKDRLVPLIELLGELDACLSIAKLFEEHKDSNARYCFVRFEQKETPYIKLDGFWHPFIGKENAVTNSIELGAENQERNVILTGSNTGGKSTSLKAVGINLLLAHTIGVVPSSSATITPFELLSTSLNLSDDTAAGVSLFKAEVLRAKDIMNQISEVSENAHGFLIIDEMFTGTNAKNGADAALSFANKLNEYDNIMYIFATHFPLVTTLGEEDGSMCANYCMDIYKDEDGNLQPTYKLTRGVSTQNIAEDILEEELGSLL